MLDEYYDPQPLKNQNFRIIKYICLVAIVLILTKNLMAPHLTEDLSLLVLGVEQLILAWIVCQLGIYASNFDESRVKVFASILAGVIAIKLGYGILITYMPHLQYQGLMLLLNTLLISLYFITGKYIRAIQHDFVGGLSYVGVLFIAKSIIILAGLLISVVMTYFVMSGVQKSIITGLWLTSNFLSIFVDFATYYILFKIFSNADLMPSN